MPTPARRHRAVIGLDGAACGGGAVVAAAGLAPRAPRPPPEATRRCRGSSCEKALASSGHQDLINPWGSSTNFFDTPESKAEYPDGASSREMTVALTALAIWTLSLRIACIRSR